MVEEILVVKRGKIGGLSCHALYISQPGLSERNAQIEWSFGLVCNLPVQGQVVTGLPSSLSTYLPLYFQLRTVMHTVEHSIF